MRIIPTLLLSLVLFSSPAYAGYKKTFNPDTGVGDFVGVSASRDVAIVCDAGLVLKSQGSGVWGCAADSGGAGSGDIDSVGDVTSGAAFDGTQGTTLTFNNAGGDATQVYGGTTMAFSKAVEFEGGNITYVDCGASIASAITAATAGDTLVLGSCTYTESAISVSKAISIKGQGPEKTIINNTGTNVATFAVTSDGFHIDGVGFTGTDVSEAIDIDCTGGTTCNNNSIRNFKINISRTLGGLHGIQLIDAGARIEHGSINYSSATTATDQVHGIFQKFVSTCELDTVSYITDVHITGTATGDSTTQLLRGLMLWNNDADTSSTNHTEYVRDVTIKLTPGNSTISSEGFVTQGGTNLLTAYVFDSNIDGGTGGGSNVNNDIRIETTTAAYFTNVTLGTGRMNNQGNLYRNGEIQAAGLTIDAITTVEDSTGATGGVGEGGIQVTAGTGGASTIATTGAGGAGAPITLTGGVGGVAASANTASTGGAGSPVTLTAGGGGAAAATGTNVGGAGGKLSLVGGSGGNASGGSSNTGGAGSSIYAYPGTGGTGATANGADGNVYLLSSDSLSDVNGNVNVNFSSDSDVIDSRIKLDVRANGNNAGIGATAYSGTAATTGTLILGKSRGTQASSTTVAADDDLGNIRFFGYDGTNWQSTASIQAEADGTVSSGTVPTRLSLFTGPVASEVRRFTIFNDGSTLFGGSTTTIPSGNTYSFDAISTTTTPTIGIVRTDTTITNGEVAGQLRFHGKDTQLTTQNAYASIQAIANGDTTTDAAAGDLAFLTTTSTAGGSPTEAGRFTTDGHLRLGGRTAASELRLLEASGSGSNYTAFKAQPQAGDVTYTLPAADGSANQILKTNGSGTLSWTTNVANVGITLDGGGSAITTGLKGYIEVPYDMTITGWTVLADTSGSIVVDVWKDTYANYPPTVADTIAGTEKPTISASTKGQDLTLSSWTTSVTAGDIIAFNVDSASTITRAHIIIRGNKS